MKAVLFASRRFINHTYRRLRLAHKQCSLMSIAVWRVKEVQGKVGLSSRHLEKQGKTGNITVSRNPIVPEYEEDGSVFFASFQVSIFIQALEPSTPRELSVK